MPAKARGEGVDVVYGMLNDRSTDSWFKRTTAKTFYTTIRTISGSEAINDAGDFRLMSRATVDAINDLPEHNRVLRFIVPALGFPSDVVEYRRDEGPQARRHRRAVARRRDGLLDGAAPARDVPRSRRWGAGRAPRALRHRGRGGGHTVAGWTSTVLIVSSVGAAQLLCLGLLGEYIGRMYTQMQAARPTSSPTTLHRHKAGTADGHPAAAGRTARRGHPPAVVRTPDSRYEPEASTPAPPP